MIGTPSCLTSAITSLRKPLCVGERIARIVHARVDGPAEVFEKRAEQAAIEIGSILGLVDHGPGRAARLPLREAKPGQPRAGGEGRTRKHQVAPKTCADSS